MSQAPLMLSVSGLRGLIGQTLTPVVGARYAAAVGAFFRDQAGGKAAHVVLGRDSRPSGPMIELAAAAGLIGAGCRVTSLGLATTPGVAVMVEHLQADGGLVITASHNPVMWNGIKALNRDGVAPPPAQAQEIIERFRADRLTFAPVEALLPMERDDSAGQVHVQRLLRHIDAAAVRSRRLKVVLDSVCGAGGPSTALLLRELGVELVHLHGEPTGLFPHPPEPTREHLVELGQAVREHRADLGLAQDPDADRLAVVDETGRYLGEEYTLALACWHVLEEATKGGSDEVKNGPGVGTCVPMSVPPRAGVAGAESAKPRRSGAVLAANLSTSRMIDDVAGWYGATVLRTPVGEANVAAAMRAGGATIGGEGNGGVIWPKVIMVRDSLTGAALLLEMLARRGRTLSQIAGGLPGYAIVKDKVNLQPGMAQKLAPTLTARYAGQKVDTQDGVRIDWPDRWVHVRPSNTEPIVRLIAEARDEAAANQLIREIREVLGLG